MKTRTRLLSPVQPHSSASTGAARRSGSLRRARSTVLVALVLSACGAVTSGGSAPDQPSTGGVAGLGASAGRNSTGGTSDGHAGRRNDLAGAADEPLTDGGSAGELNGGDAGDGGATDSAGAGGTFEHGDSGSGGAHAGSAGIAGSGGAHAGSAGIAGSGGAHAGGAGSSPSSGAGGIGGTFASSGGGAGSAGGPPLPDHCIEGYTPEPSDSAMLDGPVEYVKSNQVDLTVQPEVIAWFQARVWEQAVFQWSNIRRCKSGGATNNLLGGGINPCITYPELIPANQENTGPGDGLEFLAIHRHLIRSLKQLWPNHAEQFEGWEHFPTQASDVPPQWQASWTAWMSNIAANGAKADAPANHLNEAGFESEGAFGQWIQSTSGLHGAMHFKWVRTQNYDHGLGNQFANIDNYLFWKMHGWIDKVWDRYRAAKGKGPNDPDMQALLRTQCRQLNSLVKILNPSITNP